MATYSHKLRLKYTPAQLFDLVADVERYPEFMPWTITTRVRRRTNRVIWTDLTIGTGIIRKRFSTVATLDRPHRIAITSTIHFLRDLNRNGPSKIRSKVEQTLSTTRIFSSDHFCCRHSWTCRLSTVQMRLYRPTHAARVGCMAFHHRIIQDADIGATFLATFD